MAANQDKIHEEALKVELSITHLSQELKESVGTEKDVGQLNSRINRQLDDLRGKIQFFDKLSTSVSSEEEQIKCQNMSEYHSTQLAELVRVVRQANMVYRQSSEKRMREDLLAGNKEGLLRRRTEESIRQRTANNTDTLKELRQMLNEQVARSSETNEVLEVSSLKLSLSNRELRDLTSVVSTGSALITKYGRRVICDNILIVLGMILFILVVFYVFLSRLRLI